MGVSEVFLTERTKEESRHANGNEVDVWTERGCFRHCNGTPWPVINESNALYGDAMAAEEPADIEALVIRAKQLGAVWSELDAVCIAECPGARSLFEEGEQLIEGDDEVVVKPCPLRDRFAAIATESTLGPVTAT